LSPFGAVWNTLSHWRTQETLNFLKDANVRVPVESSTQSKQVVLASQLQRSVVKLNEYFKLNMFIEKDLVQLVNTFLLREPIASFSNGQWNIFTLVFLEALTKRNAELEKELHKNDSSLLMTIVQNCGFKDYEFKEFCTVFFSS